jgi:hypothetical protein
MIMFFLLTFLGGLEIANISLRELAAMTSSLKRTRRQLPAAADISRPPSKYLTGIPREIP